MRSHHSVSGTPDDGSRHAPSRTADPTAGSGTRRRSVDGSAPAPRRAVRRAGIPSGRDAAGRRRRATGKDEPPQRRQLALEPIDRLLEPLDCRASRPRPWSRARRSGDDGSARRAPRANRSFWIRLDHAGRSRHRRPAARARPGRRSIRRLRRTHPRAHRLLRRACCRRATSHRCRRSSCRSSRGAIIGADASHERLRSCHDYVPPPARSASDGAFSLVSAQRPRPAVAHAPTIRTTSSCPK